MTKKVQRVFFISLIFLMGITVNSLRLQNSVPLYPSDLLSYIGGFYAFEDGRNPYCADDTRLSLSERGIDSDSYQYVYSPGFLFALLPLKVLPYLSYRILWTVSGILSCWLSLFLLFLKLQKNKSHGILFLLLGSLFLIISEPLLSNAVWGNTSAFLLLAISVMVWSSFSGFLSSFAAILIVSIKVGFLPFALFVKGKKAILSLLILSLLLGMLSSITFGFNQYSRWFNALGVIGERWDYNLENNLSFTNAITSYSESNFYKMDEGLAAQDDQYRLRTHAKSKRLIQTISYTLTILFGIIVLKEPVRRLINRRVIPRNIFLSIVVLYLLTFVPFLWIHYGLFFLIPLWFLCSQSSVLPVFLFLVSILVWGSPLNGIFGTIAPVHFRFIIPLIWLFYFVRKAESDSEVT